MKYLQLTIQYDTQYWWKEKLIAFLRHVPGCKISEISDVPGWQRRWNSE